MADGFYTPQQDNSLGFKFDMGNLFGVNGANYRVPSLEETYSNAGIAADDVVGRQAIQKSYAEQYPQGTSTNVNQNVQPTGTDISGMSDEKFIYGNEAPTGLDISNMSTADFIANGAPNNSYDPFTISCQFIIPPVYT